MPVSVIEQNLATLNDVYAAFAAGDWDTWMTHVDDDSVLIEADTLPYGGRFQGQGIIEALQKIASFWTDFEYERIETYASEQSVMVYGIMTATGVATGLRVSMPLAERWIFEGPIIREVTAIYGDTASCIKATVG
jgi:ketosteroid isomerase-like protein